jgi:dihydroceramide fatty acyl 2-hydroxylase
LFTVTPWWVIPLVWLPLVVYTQTVSLQRGLPSRHLPWTIITGMLLWTFVEYLLHRYLFHMHTSSYWSVKTLSWIFCVIYGLTVNETRQPEKLTTEYSDGGCDRGNTFHYFIHGFHHKHPMDTLRLVFPPLFSTLLSAPVPCSLSAHIKST